MIHFVITLLEIRTAIRKTMYVHMIVFQFASNPLYINETTERQYESFF